MFGVSFFVAIATFKNIAGFNYAKPIGLWIVYILWPLVCAVVYIVSQLVLVFRTLEDRWPIGDIVFGTAFFTVAQVILFAFSVTICDAIKHYIDGLFFFTLCMLLSVMMVYKYWDSITVRALAPCPRRPDACTDRVYLFSTARGPRVLGRLEGDRVGGQGPAPRRRRGLWRRGLGEQLHARRAPGEPGWRRQWEAAVPERRGRRPWPGIPSTDGTVLSGPRSERRSGMVWWYGGAAVCKSAGCGAAMDDWYAPSVDTDMRDVTTFSPLIPYSCSRLYASIIIVSLFDKV